MRGNCVDCVTDEYLPRTNEQEIATFDGVPLCFDHLPAHIFTMAEALLLEQPGWRAMLQITLSELQRTLTFGREINRLRNRKAAVK